MYGIIYVIKNKVNNKYYVGQTMNERGFDGRYCAEGEGIERVYKHHLSNKERNRYYNRHLLESIEKNGFDSFEVDTCFNVAKNQDELNQMEEHYIKLFDSFKRGYNYTTGGGSAKLSEQTKRKISDARITSGVSKGKNNPMYGMSGELSPNWGVPHSEETRRKIGAGRLGKKHSEESKKKMSETAIMRGSKKGSKNGNATGVRCITTGEVFGSISEASMKYFGKNKSRIGPCCRGECSYSGKLQDGTMLKWEFIERD